MVVKTFGMKTTSRNRGLISRRELTPAGRRLARGCVTGCALLGLVAACGGSSHSREPQGTAGTPPIAGGKNSAGGSNSSGAISGRGGSAMQEAGRPGDINPGAGAGDGDGGAASTPDEEPKLGAACAAPGSLACAGPHQKLTLLCSARGKWDANQTCPSGQFCSTTPGPDLGICKAPDFDCADRQPGDAFCASDATTLMKCDEDGITSIEGQKCQAGCVDGRCTPPRLCPENLVYSCDPGCPGPNTSPSCFEVCPTPASGISPLLELSNLVNGVKFAIALPAVAANAAPCSCAKADGALQGVVFRVPSPPGGSKWRFTYPQTWEFHSDVTPSGETNNYYQGCERPWPTYSSITPGCATVRPEPTAPLIWLSAKGPETEPGTVFVELLRNADAACTP
jgi:hypothetical protein